MHCLGHHHHQGKQVVLGILSSSGAEVWAGLVVLVLHLQCVEAGVQKHGTVPECAV